MLKLGRVNSLRKVRVNSELFSLRTGSCGDHIRTPAHAACCFNSVRTKSQRSETHRDHSQAINVGKLKENHKDSKHSLHQYNDLQSQGIARLIEAYRIHGHKKAKINPLEPERAEEVEELNPQLYGLTSTEIVLENGDSIQISDLVGDLEKIFCGHIAIETSQLNTSVEKEFMSSLLFQVIEEKMAEDEKRKLAELLIKSQAVDNFLEVKFQTLKRYGGEGAESSAAFCQELFRGSSEAGIEEIVIGMPHRGRLNLLVSQLEFPSEILFRKLKGLCEFPDEALSIATGDVISHLVTSVDLEQPSGKVHITMVPPPSHLEAVNPVTMGKCRARQQTLDKEKPQETQGGDRVLNFLQHGDAAFAGQGIVAECFNMSNLEHFSVGGTIHLIVNNQLGFTTPAQFGRSSAYASDIGKMIGCPVIHVNGVYPEQVAKAAKMALKYRQMFHKDIIVDMLCYRRRGHNEVDDPTFTQPLMYEHIVSRTPVPEKYAADLVVSGTITSDDVAQWKTEMHEKLNNNLKNAETFHPPRTYLEKHWGSMSLPDPTKITHWDTGYPVDNLRYIGAKSVEVPHPIRMHDRLIKMYANTRKERMVATAPVDWATAEALAFGSLLQQDYDIRLCGQDVRRGTFSHRHAVVFCQDTGNTAQPLNDLMDGQTAKIEVVNSLLSEEAVLGFEYGVSIESPQRLVIWEAQFGDFFNGAQIIIDTYVNSGEAKWMLQSGLVMLLPHGYDGMGPEHSSCRIERFLQGTNSKEDEIDSDTVNVHVCNPTTPAQYFHLLRRQMIRNYRKPLIVASPKILLRSPAAVSHFSDMGPGTFFQPVLADTTIPDPSKVEKLLLCSGKHYYALAEERERIGKKESIAIVRLEELCPFPAGALRKELSRYSNVKNIVWAQEEPRNMGAWSFVSSRFQNLVGVKLEYAGRPVLPTPAVAIGKLHRLQSEKILADAFK